jgi:hypothetical protein
MALATEKETSSLTRPKWVREGATPCPAIDRVGQACWRDTPMKAGQARMQMSIHANVVGLLAGFKGNVPASLA